MNLASASDNWEYRLTPAASGSISDHWYANINLQTRLDDDFKANRHHVDLGVTYTGLNAWLNIGVNYRRISRKSPEDDWLKEDRFYLDLLAQHRVGKKLGISHRFRMEYNSFDAKFGDFGTVRYRLALNPPFEMKSIREKMVIGDYSLKPYGKYEIAFKSLDQSIAWQRFIVGLSKKFSDSTVGNLYYIREIRDSELSDTNLHVLGLDIRYMF